MDDGRYGGRPKRHDISDGGMMSHPRTTVYDGDAAAHRARMRAMDEEMKRSERERQHNTRITAQAEKELREHEAKEAEKKKDRAKIAADEEIYYLLS